jgi:hypothetical protein
VYTGSLAFTGAANRVSNVCGADGALSRPTALPSATTTMLVFSVIVTDDTDALVPFTKVVAAITVLSDAFLTCTAVTPNATVYVMLAVFPEYVTIPEFDITGAVNVTPNGLVCAVSPEPVLKSVGGLGVTLATFHPLMFWLNALAF